MQTKLFYANLLDIAFFIDLSPFVTMMFVAYKPLLKSRVCGVNSLETWLRRLPIHSFYNAM